jgi:hypothetical protein
MNAKARAKAASILFDTLYNYRGHILLSGSRGGKSESMRNVIELAEEIGIKVKYAKEKDLRKT